MTLPLEGGNKHYLFRLEAKINSDEIFVGGDILTLTPEKGNLHTFAALEDTAILDILLPNYDNETRICNFYYELDAENDIKELSGEKEDAEYDEEVDKPNQRKLVEKEVNGAGKELNGFEKDPEEAEQKEEKIPLMNDMSPFVKVIYALPPSDLDIEIVPYQGDPLS